MEKQKKIDVKSIECIFLGYNETSKAYRFYNLSNMTIRINGNVVFNETNRLLKIVGGIVDEDVPIDDFEYDNEGKSHDKSSYV
jgi:hypothetical protein